MKYEMRQIFVEFPSIHFISFLLKILQFEFRSGQIWEFRGQPLSKMLLTDQFNEADSIPI